MKVKEVEIFSPIYQEDGVLAPSPKDSVKAFLSNDGKWLNVSIPKALAAATVRKLKLVYNVVDMQLQTVTPLLIKEVVQPVVADEIFDIEVVMKTLIKSSSSVVTLNYDVSLFTYEANINTTYGSKRLSYPYRASLSENTGFPTSTDGWYTLTVLDIPIWTGFSPYVIGDVLYYSNTDKFVKCIGNNTGEGPETNPEKWEAMTDESWTVYASSTSRITPSDAKLRILSELLLTRNIKQAFIFPSIQDTSFKEANDKLAFAAVTKITAMREAAVAYLESGDPIKAVDMIDKIPFEYHTLFGKSKTAVMSNNNFTL